MFYLIDLERSVLSGNTTYWKANKRGYTTNIAEAGLYDEQTAKQLVSEDFDHRTLYFSQDVVKRL